MFGSKGISVFFMIILLCIIFVGIFEFVVDYLVVLLFS